MKFGILEVGSTNTKAYLYDNGNLINLGSRYIEFKNNYKKTNQILESDLIKLMNYIKEIQKETDNVYVFGTSIFRNITEEERDLIISRIKKELNVDFKVVTAEEENLYTVKGVIDNIDYTDKMAVVIGGGGSTELAIIDNKRIKQMINFNFGAMDITDKFPDLKEDTVKTSFDTILNYTLNLFAKIKEQVPVLVLAGGDYIYFYEAAKYKMEKNTLYKSEQQPYLLTFEKLDYYDHDILRKSLNKIKEEQEENQSWWDGARGMRFCMNAIARKLDTNVIIPTRINMLIGLANEIVQKKSKK